MLSLDGALGQLIWPRVASISKPLPRRFSVHAGSFVSKARCAATMVLSFCKCLRTSLPMSLMLCLSAGRCQTNAGWHARARPVARHRWTEALVLGLDTWFGTVSGEQIQWESLSPHRH